MIVKVLSLFLCLQLVDSCRLRCRNRTQCDDGWTYYKRNTTGWCMKVFVGNVNLTEAKAVCSGVGAVMSSIDDGKMYNSAANLLASTSASSTWLGAELKSECQCGASQCPVTSNCGPNGYYWTDGFTTSNNLILNNLIVTQIDANGQSNYVIREGLTIFNGGLVALSSTNLTSVLCGKQSVN
ncbi:unnamed protein product [Caenorhabditis angaria]|uniref:C-type lectin domain-containing protein n=1 Tax=Caenorhabditis angaria TaxID=860376 RepID=A0A9P1I6A3_9PELO|nr:unnamed protein product [Caenorhabditis angaria]